MNRYHFNFRRGAELVPDTRGIYLPSDEEAFDEAIRTWRDLISSSAVEGEKPDSVIEIADASGTTILTVPLGFAIRFRDDADQR